MKEKKNWNNLWKNKCPIPGCKTEGKVTKLIEGSSSSHLICPKCNGEWTYVIYTPMDATWTETKKPTKIRR